jgi:hypothetical protein
VEETYSRSLLKRPRVCNFKECHVTVMLCIIVCVCRGRRGDPAICGSEPRDRATRLAPLR